MHIVFLFKTYLEREKLSLIYFICKVSTYKVSTYTFAGIVFYKEFWGMNGLEIFMFFIG